MNVLLVCVKHGLDGAGAKYRHHFLIENGHESTLLYRPELHLGDTRPFAAVDAFVRDVSPCLIGLSLNVSQYRESCQVQIS